MSRDHFNVTFKGLFDFLNIFVCGFAIHASKIVTKLGKVTKLGMKVLMFRHLQIINKHTNISGK